MREQKKRSKGCSAVWQLIKSHVDDIKAKVLSNRSNKETRDNLSEKIEQLENSQTKNLKRLSNTSVNC